ncbi:chemoreceptor glutamine deamidase CheD [Oceanispirochaeta crateris]|uniref:Probable chemoreceptor glutamine deamidase CheD n=1 Tax=Oceanispirochaeta crateris TaxID=2518645 RepID=A0A5C1QJ11_9SPIO|nr:chemotaxis protein CheD [Oceanispirochaeta crateris]QEN07447.1 chemoreceptor glutamine deamidase CheD [Oceanispirochaeta crateris]
MIEYRNHKFNRQEIILHPGDYFCSQENIVISTILGSCISVALIDKMNGRGGMNHFLLPNLSINNPENILKNKSSRYGVFAMELLINELMKMGSNKKALIAKVFGGGSVLNFENQERNVGYMNIQFIIQFLANEKIPVAASDLGEYCGRKIIFFPDTGKVLVKKLQSRKKIDEIRKEELETSKRLVNIQKNREIVLF